MGEGCAKNTQNVPLCAFALSPRFMMCANFGDAKKTRDFSLKKFAKCYYKIRNKGRFKRDKKCTPIFFKCLTGVVKDRRIPQRRKFNLEEVISVVRNVWNSPDTNKSPVANSSLEMNEYLKNSKKYTSDVSSDVSSPMLLRRRLSAPETIMRRHMLTHQRSDSQDSSDVTQTSDVNRSYQWRSDLSTGSDSNLNKRRDLGLMRKSTLLRRMWSNSKPVIERNSRLSTVRYDWQNSFGKLSSGRSTQSLASNHSSPEHLRESIISSRRSFNGDDFREIKMAKGKKVFLSSSSSSLSSKNDDRNSHTNSFCSNCNSNFTNFTTKETMATSDTKISSTTTITPKTTETESFPTYTSASAGTSTISDNSDSAFINTKSNYTLSSNGNSRTTLCYSDIQKNIVEESEKSNENINTINNDLLNNTTTNNNINVDYTNESSTQTVETTNLNVISNVQLSESTLDLIFNKVMQDIKNTLPSGLNINTLSTTVTKEEDNNNVIKVKEIPSFYLKRKEEFTFNPEHNRIVKYMISNVGTGSPYSKPAEVPQVVVPRFSALPRTSSMEVNTSSAESTDKESDSISLVDSLEDPSSPRIDQNQINNHDDKPVRGDLSLLLPDNSNKKKNKTNKQTTTTFFIPIKTSELPEVKPVSELLPDKVREKLSKRQMQREIKMKQSKNKSNSAKSDSNYMSDSENGNNIIKFTTEKTSDFNLNDSSNNLRCVKSKKRTKPTLPKIETIRKIKVDNTKRSDNKKGPRLAENTKSKKIGTKKLPEKLSPVYTSKNEYVYNTGAHNSRIYHKTELSNSGKRIEILEIMECLDESNGRCSRAQKNRSKIPILIQPKLPKIQPVSERKSNPTYLDFEQVHVDDPKIDQLIANILIDALNKTEPSVECPKNFTKINEKRPCQVQPQIKNCSGMKYTQKFAVIPEELSQHNSTEEQKASNENCNISSKQTESDNNFPKKSQQPYKGKAALAVIRDENFSSIPKGWITFYTLHKNQGSPDSTSDEGGKNTQCEADKNNNGLECDLDKKNDCIENDALSSNKDTENYSSTSSETDTILRRHRKYTPRKTRHRNNLHNNRGWSVTVSGVNTNGEFGPDLEMRLKFPQKLKQNQNQSDSGLGEEHPHPKKTNLPHLDVKKYEHDTTSNENGKYSYREKLPDINKSVKRTKHIKSVIASMEPRQTKTSARRFSLHQSKCEKFPVDERQLAEVLRCLPHILSVTGNSISPERKPKVPTMSERDLTRHICANHN